MGCPAGAMIQEDIERAVGEIPGVGEVKSDLTFEPPWTPDKMSDDAKFILGFGSAGRRRTRADTRRPSADHRTTAMDGTRRNR